MHLQLVTSTKSCVKGQDSHWQGTVRHNSNSIFVFLPVEMTRLLYCECSAELLKVYNCILFCQCNCPAKLRVAHHVRQVTMECARMHTVTPHKNDKSKYLSWLRSGDEDRAVDWFLSGWTGDNKRWMLADLGPILGYGMVSSNNGQEISHRQ